MPTDLQPHSQSEWCSGKRVRSPRLSQAGIPSRSEGRGGAEREPDRAKAKYQSKTRSILPDIRIAPTINEERFADIHKVATRL